MQTSNPHVDEVRRYLSTRKALNLFRSVSSRYTNTPFDMDDVVQDIALRCIEQAPLFRGGNVAAWARTVAVRTVLNEVRKTEYKRQYVEYDERVDARIEPTPPADVIVAVEQLGEQFGALLTEDQLETCAGLRRHGGDVTTLAKEVGVNTNTMYTRKKKLLKMFASLV
jgi:RNA polymerase sigma factor (sigma-70 family)